MNARCGRGGDDVGGVFGGACFVADCTKQFSIRGATTLCTPLSRTYVKPASRPGSTEGSLRENVSEELLVGRYP